MKSFSSNLTRLAKWFNKLPPKTRKIILSGLEEERIVILTDKDSLSFKELRNIVQNICLQKEEVEVIESLVSAGFEHDDAIIICEYSGQVSDFVEGIQIIKNMAVANFASVVQFVLQKMVLYDEYSLYPSAHFIKLGQFKGSKEAKKVLQVVLESIYEVRYRRMSPDLLSDKLQIEFDLPSEFVTILTGQIRDNLFDLHQSVIMELLQRVLNSEKNKTRKARN